MMFVDCSHAIALVSALAAVPRPSHAERPAPRHAGRCLPPAPICQECGKRPSAHLFAGKTLCRLCCTGKSDVTEASQTARNEPCPCGSGRKYKRCCKEAKP